MRSNLTARILFLIFTFSLVYERSEGQQLVPSDFTLWTGPDGIGTTLIGSSITINGGRVGARKLVQTTGNVTFTGASIHSGDKIILTNSNIVGGLITAANSSLSTGTVISVGSSTNISGNIDANGNVVVGGGTVSGKVTIPADSAGIHFTYSGPAPGGGLVRGPRTLPTLPEMPAETTFPAAGTSDITGNATLTPNAVTGIATARNVIYSGNKTLKLNGPGVYVFNSFQFTGNSNKIEFNFNGSTTGLFYIYVHGNADFGKLSSAVINGNSTSASRIYLETHGDGLGTSIPGNSFIIANGSSGGGSKWMGTVYARKGINIGSGTGSSTLTGTFLSSTQISIQSGVTVNYAPFGTCWPPIATAGISVGNVFTPTDTIPLDFTGHTTLSAVTTPAGALFTWQATKGGIISSNANTATITVSAAGTYIVSAYDSDPACASKDTVIVLPKIRNIIGAELLSIYQNYDPNNPSSDLDSLFLIEDGYVTIDIICKVDTGIVSSLLRTNTALYGLKNVLPNGLSKHTVTGDFPIIHLLNLNARSDILVFVKPYWLPSNNGGIVISQGDSTIRSYLVRKGFHVDGTGIKIGVISDSYNTITDPSKIYSDPCANINQTLNVNTAAVDLINGDVSNVTVVQDLTRKGSDEGRAMMQIIQDVAPGSQKYFFSGFFTAGYLAQSIEYLASLGCNVLVDDVTYADEPMLKDGVVAKSVNKVRDLGVFYSTSAGNFAGRSYEKLSNFVDASSIGFTGKKAHNFGNDNAHPDFFQKVWLRPGTHFIVFQWLDNNYSQDELAGTQFDLDFYLTPADKTDGTGLIGFNRDNLFGDAKEFFPMVQIASNGTCDTAAIPYNILIVNNTPTGDPLRIKYVAFKQGFRVDEYNEGNSTIVGHANAEGAFTIGAVRFNHVLGHPLLPSDMSNITKPQIEYFSSIGGTLGRLKPEIAGVDGVDVTTLMGGDYPSQALNNFSNFFGTSAAAPHVAGAAALVMQARADFLLQATNTPAQVAQLKTLFQSTAVDMRPPGLIGYDYLAGAGLIDVDAAIRTFASPTPFEISLIKPTNVIPCQDPFVLTIKGENFSDNTKIYLVTTPVDPATIITPEYILNNTEAILTPDDISENNDTIHVTINNCVGNPLIIAYTPPTVRVPPVIGGAEDGGFSNSIKLFSHEIVVQTLNVSRKYGQLNPMPATIVTYDGVVVTSQTTPSLADLGLTAATLNQVETFATVSSSVGTYAIKVYRTFDPANPADVALTNQYSYVFKNGLITIDKMPLTVTPDPITMIVQQPLGNVTFNYAFDHTNVPNPQAIINDLKAAHEAYLPNNALAVIKDFATSGLHISDLENMNTIASFRAINNSRKFQLDAAGEMIPLTDPNTFPVQYLVDVAAQSIIDYIQNPALAKFYAAYPGINKKALLGGNALNDGTAKVEVNSLFEPIVNGTLSQTLSTNTGPVAPIFNDELVQIVNGQLVQFNSETLALEPIVNEELVQIVNDELVQIVNGTIVPIGTNELVLFNNNVLLMKTEINGIEQLVQVVNGLKVQETVGGGFEPIPNSELVVLVNNQLFELVDGALEPIVNDELVQLVNDELVQMVNDELVQIVNGQLVEIIGNNLEPIVNEELVQIVNEELVQIVNNGNGTFTIVPIGNDELVQLVNDELVQMVNDELVQIVNAQIINGTLVGTNETFVNYVNLNLVNSELVVIVNDELVQIVNGDQKSIANGSIVKFPNDELVQIVNQVGANNESVQVLEPIVNDELVQIVNQETLEPIVNDELVQIVNTNTTGAGNTNNNTGVIIDEEDVNDDQNNWLGPMFSINMITGLGLGTNYLIPGKLVNPNFDITYVRGIVNGIPNPCILTRAPAKNFGSTPAPQKPTSLWLSITTKVSGQLSVNGDYLFFKSGSVTFNAIASTPQITDFPIPNGKIIADNSVTVPITSFDANSNTWITKVPPGFASSSDIYVTGAIINSSTGFVKQNGNTSSVVKGAFYCTKNFSDQWTYGTAAYQQPPAYNYVTYAQIGGAGQIQSINGTYRAGAPIPIIQYLVQGGSGGGGNNYTGSSSSFDNFTACPVDGSSPSSPVTSVMTFEETQAPVPAKAFQLIPNPASDNITLSFIPSAAGVSVLSVFTIDGRKVMEINNGFAEAGKHYTKKIDVSKLKNGVYLAQLRNGEKLSSKKIIIAR